MKLPDRQKAEIPEAKITDYLLSSTHPVGKGKAGFFVRFGFLRDEWEVLAKALLQHAMDHEVTYTEESPFGTRYIIEGSLQTPDGREPLVRAVWFVNEGEETPRFVTAYPLDVDVQEENDGNDA